MNIDLSKFKHSIAVKVRFSDLDAMRHVNNAKYLSYLEEGRIAYFNEALSFPKDSLAFDAVVARIRIDYINQICLGDAVKIYTRISEIGAKSSKLENLIVIENESVRKIAAKAETTLVSFDFKTKKTVPIPEQIKEKISSFEEL